jgi:DNA-binding CsgD family transcriptional regulator
MATNPKNRGPRSETAGQSTTPSGAHIEPSTAEWAEFAVHFKLSPRQLQIAKLLYADCPVKVLASRLRCSRSTANTHRAKLYAHLRITGRTALVREILEFCIARRSGGTLPPRVD